MAIATEATEAKATALITELRRALACGGTVSAKFMKDMLAQLESATINDLSGRTNVAHDNSADGRNVAEATVADA